MNLISTRTNIYVLAIGIILAMEAQLILLIPFVRKTEYGIDPFLT